MAYKVVRNEKYDYAGQRYKDFYPNLHKHPATMLPRIGADALIEFDADKGSLLDPYCGSGSSFASGLEYGMREMHGNDLNPLAALISKVKFTKLGLSALEDAIISIGRDVFDFYADNEDVNQLEMPAITNISAWFSKHAADELRVLRHFIYLAKDENVRNFLLLPFSEIVRQCSFQLASSLKLQRKEESKRHLLSNAKAMYFNKLEENYRIYKTFYHPKISRDAMIENSEFKQKDDFYDVVLTSPPYGDSRSTVAYGQFSMLSNEWLGIDYARKIDSMLMGGGRQNLKLYEKGVMADYVSDIARISEKRALEVSAFYYDLEESIRKVANSVKKGGKAIYVVGNRTVKKVQLPTDQFIAEKFEKYGLSHAITYERFLCNKAMPVIASPSGKAGETAETMLFEYIVVCEK